MIERLPLDLRFRRPASVLAANGFEPLQFIGRQKHEPRMKHHSSEPMLLAQFVDTLAAYSQLFGDFGHREMLWHGSPA
jgi:hypothetical protein